MFSLEKPNPMVGALLSFRFNRKGSHFVYFLERRLKPDLRCLAQSKLVAPRLRGRGWQTGWLQKSLKRLCHLLKNWQK
ncbi:hypothetical protein F2P79_025250 [Pimephales promelas]|nr:hypothetical protein F2P79_025250 [Pimephales promelas]